MKKSSMFGMFLSVMILFAVTVHLAYGEEEPFEEWIARYNGPTSYYDWAYAIAVGPEGNVYVTGQSYVSGKNYDYITIAYDSTGNQLWEARYNGPENSFDYARAIAVGPEGNVYVRECLCDRL